MVGWVSQRLCCLIRSLHAVPRARFTFDRTCGIVGGGEGSDQLWDLTLF
jgi:hypothetical protein